MRYISELSPKEADAFDGATLDEILNAISIVEYELMKLSLIRRAMLATGRDIFHPTEHNIKSYISHLDGT